MRPIDADVLKKQAITLVTGTRTWEVVTVSDIDNAPTIDDLSEYSDKLWKLAYERGKSEIQQVTRKDLESWLYKIAMNNFGNELERSCIEIISRLDGFERYVKEKEAENE